MTGRWKVEDKEHGEAPNFDLYRAQVLLSRSFFLTSVSINLHFKPDG